MFILTPILSTLPVLFVIVVVLGVIVIIHEFGHFIAARRSGVLVEEFGFGMPPRVIGIQRIDGKVHIVHGSKAPLSREHTVYSLNALPIGGFVRLYGDGDGGEGGVVDPRLAHVSLDHAAAWKRLIIMIAGVTMNIVLAVAIYTLLLAKNGFVSEQLPLIGKPTFHFGTVEKSIGITSIVQGSPAEKAGLRAEEIVIEVRPQKGNGEWIPMRAPSDLISIVKAHDGVPVEVHVKDFTSGVERTVTVKPIYNVKEKRAMIGAQLMELAMIRYNTSAERIFSGFLHSWNMGSYNLQAIGTVFSYAKESGKPELVAEAVSGPIGIGRVVDKILKNSGGKMVENLLNLMALISLSLATMNILPFPALDGGRVLLLLPELLFRKRINRTFEQYVNIAGFFVLIAFSIIITVKDVIRLW